MLVQHVYQFGKSRRHIYSLFVFDALQSLTNDLFNDHGIFLNIRIALFQIQKQRNKRRLAVGSHQSIDLILNGLYTAAQLVSQADMRKFVYRSLVKFIPAFILNLLFEFFIGFSQIFPQMLNIH